MAPRPRKIGIPSAHAAECTVLRGWRGSAVEAPVLGRSNDEADFQLSARTVDVADIPTIDFAPFLSGTPEERQATADQIAEAASRIGFFYLVNHGVPAELRDGVFKATKAFYDLPPAEQEAVRATPDWYRGLCSLSQNLGPGQRYFEQYRVQDEFPPDPATDPNGIFYGPNRWPEAQPGLAPATMAYFRAATELSGRLLHAFALGMGLPEDRFDAWFNKPLSQLSLLYYRALPDGAETHVQNAVAHTDEGPFTILAQGEVGGLEVRRRDGVWVAAPPAPDAYVINIGNMMMWWSNGRYLSNMHRVRNTSGQDRLSVPFFFNPDREVVVEPLPELVRRDGEARYPAVQAGDHLTHFFATLQTSPETTGAPSVRARA
jgi:isopenicillin N synthase-like dioxygenase